MDKVDTNININSMLQRWYNNHIIINKKMFYVLEGWIRATRFLMLMNFKPLFEIYNFKYTKLKLK